MTGKSLLHAARQAGLEISLLTDGALRVDGPVGVRDVFRDKIRAHKQELIDAIQDETQQRKERERRLREAIRQLVRECQWLDHLERCSACTAGRPGCASGSRLWEDCGDGIERPDPPTDPEMWERGAKLLAALWAAGFRLQIVKNGGEYGLNLIREAHSTPALLERYCRDHRAAIAVLVHVCQQLGIDPLQWHTAVDYFGKVIVTCFGPEMAHRGPGEADKAK
ncbi:MAG: hypothetical protein WBH86_15110 [Thermogutta sp.]|nr:hypothetical protein [Thermogutta sp.]